MYHTLSQLTVHGELIGANVLEFQEKKFIPSKKYCTMKSSIIIMHAWSAGGPNLRNEMVKQDWSETMNHMITVTSG